MSETIQKNVNVYYAEKKVCKEKLLRDSSGKNKPKAIIIPKSN